MPVGHEALQARFMLAQHMAAAAQHPPGFGQWCEQVYPDVTDAAETGGAGFFLSVLLSSFILRSPGSWPVTVHRDAVRNTVVPPVPAAARR